MCGLWYVGVESVVRCSGSRYLEVSGASGPTPGYCLFIRVYLSILGWLAGYYRFRAVCSFGWFFCLFLLSRSSGEYLPTILAIVVALRRHEMGGGRLVSLYVSSVFSIFPILPSAKSIPFLPPRRIFFRLPSLLSTVLSPLSPPTSLLSIFPFPTLLLLLFPFPLRIPHPARRSLILLCCSPVFPILLGASPSSFHYSNEYCEFLRGYL